jgi:hypothetical protein
MKPLSTVSEGSAGTNNKCGKITVAGKRYMLETCVNNSRN